MERKKAQAWGFDLAVGAIIFLVGILSFYIFTTNISGSDSRLQQLQKNGELIANSLMSEGSPSNWNRTNVVRIGLLTENRIDLAKLEEFRWLTEFDYNRTKTLFRVNTDYFVFFDMEPGNGFGRDYAEARELIKVTRVVVYNQSVTTLNVYSWMK